MKKFKSEELINELKTDVQQLILATEAMKGMDKMKLAYPLADGRWTAVQCLEHLNSYSRIYLPAIESAVHTSQPEKSAWFNSGRLGNYFTNSMKPTTVYEIRNKMKTMKRHNPPASLNVDKVLGEFIDHQKKLLQLLDLSRDRNLNTIRIPLSISRFIKFKLGDTFRFLIAHEQRHMVQARNAIHSLGIPTDKFPVILQAAAL